MADISASLCNRRCVSMGCGCGYWYSPSRGFLTKDEKIDMLKEYKGTLEKEVQGIEEKIRELQRAS